MPNNDNSKIINHKSKILILMGPPGSGKGTQAKKLAIFLNYYHLSTGDLARAILADPQADPAEKKEAEKSRQGLLVGDWLIYRLAFREIEKNLQAGRGVILDGAIRNLAQAQKFGGFFTEKNFWPEVKVIWIDLPDDEARERLTKRRVCLSCNEIIPYLSETKYLKNCPKCGGELAVRPDDNPEVLKKRFSEQGALAQKPILDFFAGRGAILSVDGRPAIEKVFEEMKKSLGV